VETLTPIRRLLIANRGEIAVRVARAARERGLTVLGVYSEADAGAMFRDSLDESICIGAGPAIASYLDIERVIDAAKRLRADAIHPGYGFLSERAAFARATIDAGLRFVGPSPEAIAAMGSKIDAKRRVSAAGVPVVPGYDGPDLSPERLRSEAARIGAPVLIKASAGGGGRGMRVVADLAEFDEALDSARREAQAAFGDDAVLLERYLARPRHIEVQIVGDTYRTIVHLGERECSIQRRHQKVIEESPSVAIDAAQRARIGAAAVRAAASVNYTSAGTVEFLLDADDNFWFLEMNARLQVEHPVTEFVYGVDLVALQLAIADGEPLPFTQTDLRPRGWAIEARLNAEDPTRDYLPSSGSIDVFDVPFAPGVRVDTGVRDGSTIPIFYDSLLAKIIAWAPDRDLAISRLGLALAQTRVAPLPTNLPLLRAILADAAFREGDLSTSFLDERRLLDPAAAPTHESSLLAAAALVADGGAWRAGGIGIPIRLLAGDRTIVAEAARTGVDGLSLSGDLSGTYVIAHRDGAISIRSGDGREITGTASLDPDGVTAVIDGVAARFLFPPPPSPHAARSAGTAASGTVTAPMPGKIASVAVRLGDVVAERALLVVLEAMKMEHRIVAPLGGTVDAIFVEAGQIVGAGTRLVAVA